MTSFILCSLCYSMFNSFIEEIHDNNMVERK